MKTTSIEFLQECLQKGKLITAGCFVMGLSAGPALAVDISSSTVYFSGTVDVQRGDISDFFSGAAALPGVCQGDDDTPSLIPGAPGDTRGLNEAPSDGTGTKDNLKHPSGFNQRKILSAYNPHIGGGTLYIGIDLPGGTGSPSNPTFQNDSYGGVTAVGQVLPFDSDGNGNADTIGQTIALGNPIPRCLAPTGDEFYNVLTCTAGSAGTEDNPRAVSGAVLGARENYQATVSFGYPSSIDFTVEYFQNQSTPAGVAQLTATPLSILPNVQVSTTAVIAGVPAYDVIFAITGLEGLVPDKAARLQQHFFTGSGSNRDGAGNGEDQIMMDCEYFISDENALDPQNILRFKSSVKDPAEKRESSSETIYYRQGSSYRKISDKVKK